MLIKNPKYAEEKQSETSEVEKEYTKSYSAYSSGNYPESFALSSVAVSKYGKTAYTPKFEFIKAMSAGKIKGVDSLETGLKQLVALYPKSDITPLANDILNSIKKQKNPEMYNDTPKSIILNKDTFQVKLESEHFLLGICPDDPKIANGFKSKLDVFCKKYYSTKVFNITSTLFGKNMQLILLKSFTDASECSKFMENLNSDKDVFTEEVKKEMFTILNMAADNLPVFYKKQNINGYQLFYNDNYKAVDKAIGNDSNKLK
jgi:hypothetical protein